MDKLNHYLVPKQSKLNDSEKEKLFEKYKISLKELPKISVTDPSITHLDTKPGDVIKIIRESKTAGEAIYYRGVIDD